MEAHDTLDYAEKNNMAGIYRYARILPNNGSSSLTGLQSSTTECVFDIPAKLMNFSRSYLAARLEIPLTAGYAPILQLGGASLISRISLQTLSGMFLCDLPNVAEYTKVMWPIATSSGDFSNMSPSGVALTAASLTQPWPFFGPAHDGTDWPAGFQTGNMATPATVGRAYSRIYHQRQDGGAGAVEGAPLFADFMMPFHMLIGTILALDKDLFFGEQLQLRVVFNPATKITFARHLTTATIGDVAAFTQGYTLTNTHLMVANEVDPVISAGLIQQVIGGSGIKVSVPYTYGYKNSLAGAGAMSATIRLNRAHGARLMRVVSSAFSAVESSATALNNCNYPGPNGVHPLVTSWNTNLNYSRLQDQELSCLNGDDYRQMYPLIEGSSASSGDAYKEQGNAMIDSFSPGAIHEAVKRDHMTSGMSLDMEQNYSIDVVAPVAIGLYTFATTQRLLDISRAGVQIM